MSEPGDDGSGAGEHAGSGSAPPGDISQAMATAFAAALAPLATAVQNLSVVPPPAQAPSVTASGPSAGTVPDIQNLPANTIKLPVFEGTMPDPRSNDKNKEVSASPALVSSTLQRIDAFFASYQHSFPTDQLKLSALISCFPPGSPASAWYESDDGMLSFGTFADFRVAFQSHFGPTEVDKQRYDEQLKSFAQASDESVVAYYTRFKQLCAELKAVGKPVQLHWQKTTFVLGLKEKLKREVSRIFNRDSSLSLEQLYSEAEMEESLQKPPVRPAVRGIRGKTPRKCFWCKSPDHLGKDCPKVNEMKRNGTWKDKPPPKQGGAPR